MVLKKLVSETALQSGLIEFYGVAGEAWDGSEGYSLFLNEEILPLLLPLAMGSTPSAEAQAALSRFPAELLNPLLPNPPAVLPSIKSPELLAALLSNEASGMRRSLLRGSGGGIAKREVAPSLLEGARAAAGVLEGLAEKPPRAGGKPGFLLGALHAAANSGAGAPSVVLGKREKAIADGVQGLGGVLLSDQVILGRLGLVEGFIRGFEGVWRLCSVVAENAIATGSKPISTRERAEKWADDLIGKIKDPKSPLEAGNAALASAGLTVSLVRAGEAEVGTRIGRGLLPLFLEGGEGNDEVGAARMVAIARVAAVVIDRTDEKGWLRVVEALKAGIEGEGWTRWSAAVAMGGVLRSVPNNFVAFDMGLQSLLSLPDSEVGKGIGLAACAAAVKEADPQLFDELIEVAMVNLDGFLARKPTAKTAEFAGIDGAAFFAGWSAPLLSPEQRGRAKSLLLKAFESINDKKDLALHAQFAIALSHSFANDPDSASEHTARLASIANAATPSFSSLVSIPSLLGHDILSSQLSPTAIDSAADPAPASKLLSKLTSIASTSAELRMARMSATVSGKICGVTLEADSGPTLLGGKKEPADLSRLDKETSAIRAVFEALSAEPNELLVDALTRIEVALPAVDWLPLMNGLWNSGDGNRKSLLLSFFSRHCVVSGSRSLLDFLVSRCDPKVWGSLDIQLQERILGDAGIGKLLDIAGLEPAEPDLDEPEAAEETPKMTIAPTKLLSLISASFDEALSKPEPTALQFVLLATLHDRLAEHRTGSHSETAEIPLAAQLASLLCRVFATMPTPTDPISLRLLRLCTESIACDSRVFEYFLGGDADGDPAHDVVKVCVAWELSARSKAVADFGMSVPALLSAILENEFSAMDPGAGRRARMFAVMQALAVQLGADEEAESRQLLTGKEARLPKGLRTALARRTVVMRWLGRLLDTGIVVGSGTPEALSEYMWLVLGSFVEMAFRGDWWDLEPLHAEGPDAETEESTRRFEFEPELVEAEDGIVLAGRLGRLLSTLLSTTMATDSKRFPEVVSQHTACTQILRRVLRVHSAAKAISSGTHIELAVLAGLREVLNGNRILLDALVAAEREAWTELA